MTILKKLRIYSNNVFAMSFPRKVALNHLASDAVQIRDHILKCVVYKDVRGDDTKHWIDEIASWLADASQIKCDSRLKLRDILSTTFGELGSEEGDAMIILKAFKKKYCQNINDPYPDFQVTPQLVTQVYQVCSKIRSECAPKLLENNVYTQTDWSSIISPILMN